MEIHLVHVGYVFEVLMLIIIMVMTLIGNLLTIWVMCKNRRLRRQINSIFIINLAIVDLLEFSGSMVFSLVSLIDGGHLLRSHTILCRVNGFLSVLGPFANVSSVVVIAFHRFVCIVLSKRVTFNRRHAYAILTAVWSFATISALPSPTGLTATSRYTPNTHHCSPNLIGSCYYYFYSLGTYVITSPMLLLFYIMIIKEIRKRDLKLKKFQSNSLSYGVSESEDFSVTCRGDSDNRAEGKMKETSFSLKNQNSRENKRTKQLSQMVNHPLNLDTENSETELSEIVCSSTTAGKKSASREMHSLGGTKAFKHKVKAKRDLKRLSSDKRVALTSGMLVLTTTCCWLPYSVLNNCFDNVTFSHGAHVFAMWLGFTNSAIDPFIYSLMNKRMRSTLYKLLTPRKGGPIHVVSKSYNSSLNLSRNGN